MNGQKIFAYGLAFLLIFTGSVGLVGCEAAKEERPDLSALGKIQTIAREDGSGTRAQFEELLRTDEKRISQTVSSTEDMTEAVAADSSSIGYAAMSALTDLSSIKVLSVDGTAPSVRTIQDKTYPLVRKYYLAWMGDLSDLEREFLTYVRGAGQKFVAQEAVPIGKETSFLSLKPSGSLTVTGSTSVAPLMRTLAEHYETCNPNAQILVQETDSSQGLREVMQGKADLAMTSRDLTDYEQEILSEQEIAADAIAIIVNRENPLENLNSSEIKEIYDGTKEEWKEFGE